MKRNLLNLRNCVRARMGLCVWLAYVCARVACVCAYLGHMHVHVCCAPPSRPPPPPPRARARAPSVYGPEPWLFWGTPTATPAQTVLSAHGRARFTVLSPRLLRIEWSPTGVFEDRRTLAVWNREIPPPPFTVVTQVGRGPRGAVRAPPTRVHVHRFGCTHRAPPCVPCQLLTPVSVGSLTALSLPHPRETW
jgi:hypothetical protein